jgi:hypothetical protein
LSCVGAKISVLSNAHGGKWFIFACIFTIIPFFPIITRLSTNLLVDSIIYDVIILIAYLTVFFLNGLGEKVTVVQYIGIGFILFGMILTKVRF